MLNLLTANPEHIRTDNTYVESKGVHSTANVPQILILFILSSTIVYCISSGYASMVESEIISASNWKVIGDGKASIGKGNFHFGHFLGTLTTSVLHGCLFV